MRISRLAASLMYAATSLSPDSGTYVQLAVLSVDGIAKVFAKHLRS